MTDEFLELASQTTVEGSESAPNEVSPAVSKKTNRKTWIIAGSVIGGFGLCIILCIILAIVAGGTSMGLVFKENAPVASVIDKFMRNMEAKDFESAYALFSPRSQRQTPISDLEKLAEGNNHVLFDGYKNVSIESLNLNAAVNSNPDMPQGRVANVSGTISYKGNFTGQFSAILEKVDDQWMIHHISVIVPPEKFQP